MEYRMVLSGMLKTTNYTWFHIYKLQIVSQTGVKNFCKIRKVSKIIQKYIACKI